MILNDDNVQKFQIRSHVEDENQINVVQPVECLE